MTTPQTKMIPTNTIPDRRSVPPSHCWNLNSLFEDFDAFYVAFNTLKSQKPSIQDLKGKLSHSADQLATVLEFYFDIEKQSEALSYYAFLKTSQDGQDSQNQEAEGKVTQLLSEIQAEFSFLIPEILSIEEASFLNWLTHACLQPYGTFLDRVYRYKSHTLSESEEKILSLQTMFSGAPQLAFASLTNADMTFGMIETPEGDIPLTQSTFGKLRMHENADVRKKTYQQFFKVFDQHKHTLTALLHGSVQKDVFDSRVRNFNSSLEAKLFTHNIPVSVYTQLIETVRKNLPVLHQYYVLRKKTLKLDTLYIYDTRVPITAPVTVNHSYEEAVDVIINALKPLGDKYTHILKNGLLNGWVDRYENKGKRSGAFSAGSYKGDPYILMNYKEDHLDDVFTLAHEAGHSMHSYYSSKSQPFQDYQYTIFVAEVASTFNEQLLAHYLLNHSNDPKLKAYLINKQIDDMIATLFRQTMFAEFELKTHTAVENGQPLTLEYVQSIYSSLLKDYFGPDVTPDPLSDLEAFYIPHFYSAFYVYQYATGISAAITLSHTVLNAANDDPLNAYLNFLKNGGKSFPIDQLKLAGVDMSSPVPVENALAEFAKRVSQLKSLLV